MSKNSLFRRLSICFIGLIALFLTLSEAAYRLYFGIQPMGRPIEEFIYIFVFGILFYYAHYRVTKVFLFAFVCLSFIANNLHYEVYQSWINGINYYLAVTEVSEVTQTGLSMASKLLPCAFWGMFDCALFLVILYIPRPKTSRPIADILFICLFAVIFARSFNTNQTHGVSPKTSYGKMKSNYFSFGYFVGRVAPYKLFDLSSIKDYQSAQPQKIKRPLVKHIIFIMGESESAAHVSTFGYPRETSPYLTKLSNNSRALVKQLYSAGFMTGVAIPHLFNAIPYPNGTSQIMMGNTNLLNLAQQQGFKTHWYTAQSRNDMGILNLIGRKWIDEIRFPENFGYKTSESMPDDELLQVLPKIDFETQSQFVVLHQRASHTPYGQWLTESKAFHFGNGIVDRYDATIYNTDQFIQKVHAFLTQTNVENYLLIYTSDHGAYVTEKVYNQGTVRKDSYTVPLMVFSDNSAVTDFFKDIFNPCSIGFHQQLSTGIIRILGYDMEVAQCNRGVVNGNLLSGDAGYLLIEGNQEQWGGARNLDLIICEL